jgi:hypothetical protein
MRAWIDRHRDSLVFGLSVAAVFLGVLVAWRHGALSSAWLEKNKDAISAACSLVTAAVLVLGAVASYLRFFRGRTLSLRAELALDVSTHPTAEDFVLHAVTLRVRNVGNATIWNPVPLMTLEAYGPPGARVSESVSQWSEETLRAEGSIPVVEPGETVMFFAVRRIPVAAWAVVYAAALRADRGDTWQTSRMVSNPRPACPADALQTPSS